MKTTHAMRILNMKKAPASNWARLVLAAIVAVSPGQGAVQGPDAAGWAELLDGVEQEILRRTIREAGSQLGQPISLKCELFVVRKGLRLLAQKSPRHGDVTSNGLLPRS